MSGRPQNAPNLPRGIAKSLTDLEAQFNTLKAGTPACTDILSLQTHQNIVTLEQQLLVCTRPRMLQQSTRGKAGKMGASVQVGGNGINSARATVSLLLASLYYSATNACCQADSSEDSMCHTIADAAIEKIGHLRSFLPVLCGGNLTRGLVDSYAQACFQHGGKWNSQGGSCRTFTIEQQNAVAQQTVRNRQHFLRSLLHYNESPCSDAGRYYDDYNPDAYSTFDPIANSNGYRR